MVRPSRMFAILIALSLTVSGFAQTQIAVLTSTAPFQLRGANVNPAPSVPSWPVMAGDSFQAGNAPLRLIFPDDSMSVFAPGAAAKLGVYGGIPVVQLESGVLHYTLKTLSAVKFQCKDTPITITELVGDLQCGRSSGIPPQWWIAAAGGAVVAGVAISRRNGPPVSPANCNNGSGSANAGLPACH